MTVRSRQLAAGIIPSTANVTVLTVPVGHVYLVKSIILENPGGITEPTPRVLSNAMDGTLRVIHVFPAIASNGSYAWEFWWVLDAGDTLGLAMPTSGLGRYIVSGADLLI